MSGVTPICAGAVVINDVDPYAAMGAVPDIVCPVLCLLPAHIHSGKRARLYFEIQHAHLLSFRDGTS